MPLKTHRNKHLGMSGASIETGALGIIVSYMQTVDYEDRWYLCYGFDDNKMSKGEWLTADQIVFGKDRIVKDNPKKAGQ